MENGILCLNITEDDDNQSNENYVSNIELEVLTEEDRKAFAVLYCFILVISVILNAGAIFTISKRNYRFFQKTCIVALAISDIVTVIAFSINGLETFSNSLIKWTLGSFMCQLVPMGQAFGVLSSSLALLVIAMDRYRCIVKSLNKRWDPRKLYCILGVLVGWIACAGMCVPMYLFYYNEPVIVIFLENGTIPENYTSEYIYMCIAPDKAPLQTSYLINIICVFAPLVFIFFWFYYNIAELIWRHRKPVQAVTEEKRGVSYTESSTTKTTDLSNKHKLPNVVLKKAKNEQMKKKIRTFRVIILLVTSFIVCRFPFWVFNLIKFTYRITGYWIWRATYLIIALNIFGTILNPLLYTYLSITIKVACKISKVVRAILCCFFSDEEFVEFEKKNGNAMFVNGFKDKIQLRH